MFVFRDRIYLSDTSVWAQIHKYLIVSTSHVMRLKSCVIRPCNLSPFLSLFLCLPVSSSGYKYILYSVLPVSYSFLNSVQIHLFLQQRLLVKQFMPYSKIYSHRQTLTVTKTPRNTVAHTHRHTQTQANRHRNSHRHTLVGRRERIFKEIRTQCLRHWGQLSLRTYEKVTSII